MATSDPDYYSILGATDGSSREEIERLYKRLAQQHHPDLGGDEEQMKAINEAWRVLGDADARREYDAKQSRFVTAYEYTVYAQSTSQPAEADAVYGRIAGASLCIGAGLLLILLVRFHYVVFLWPLALLGTLIVLFGIFMAHGALVFARERMRPGHFAHRFVWAQELLFWIGVATAIAAIVYLITII